MNDVLPKPFTKDGLLSMLEKHLAHLKKPVAQAIDGMVPPSQVPAMMPISQRVSLKDEDSPAKSPATTSNWNSPNQITGVSPVASTVTDEYMNTVAGVPGVQQVPGIPVAPQVQAIPGVQPHPAAFAGMQPGMAFNTSPQIPRQPQGHRRQISEISGGDDMATNVKRQQMYAQSVQQQAQPIPQMQRPR